MENIPKKSIQLWIRGNSKGELNISKIKCFILTCIEAFDKMDPDRNLETILKFTSKNVVSYKKNNAEFEIWFEMEDALDIWRYSEVFKLENFHLPFKNSDGNKESFETTFFKVRYDGSETFNIKK